MNDPQFIASSIEVNQKIMFQFDQKVHRLIADKKLFPVKGIKDCWATCADDIFLPHLVISACLHGNEIFGLSCLDQLFDLALNTPNFFISDLNILFIIGNRPAIMANQRHLGVDLNRSFLFSGTTQSPLQQEMVTRALAIEKICQKANAIIDLHQTTAPSQRPFALIRNQPSCIGLLNLLSISELFVNSKNQQSKYPLAVITYQPGNFSADGASFSSFAAAEHIPFVTLEIMQAGLWPLLQEQITEGLKEIIKLKASAFMKLQDQTWSDLGKYEFYEEIAVVKKNDQKHHLPLGIMNFSEIKVDFNQQPNAIVVPNKLEFISDKNEDTKSEALRIPQSTDHSAEEIYYALFPKYGHYQQTSSELVRILKKSSPRLV